MLQRNFTRFFLLIFLLSTLGCQKTNLEPKTFAPTSLRDVPSLKLNFRFETDVPEPTLTNPAVQTDERNEAVQANFDQNRQQESVDKTITAPNKQKVLVVYHKATDQPSEFRLDMYTPDGKLVQKITPDTLAVHFAETIVWAPDSSAVAFVAMFRTGQTGAASTKSGQPSSDANAPTNSDPSSNSDPNANNQSADSLNANSENANAAPAQSAATPEPPKTVLTFRSEQIYVCDAEGGNIKPITQNEGLIYFYFVWSPDSTALAALAATFQEWNYLQYQAESKGENYTPVGRPRLVEKTGRERRLDDNSTTVQPVWSPDSAKIAVAFDKQVRIYDAIGDAPTQAAIPLRNQLLISSKSFDEQAQLKEQSGDGNANTNSGSQINSNANTNANQTAAAPPVNQAAGLLPDENTLVSFNPIINLEWTEDKMLYLQTGYIKLMKNEADSARSYLRWHRLIFSPQVVTR